MTRFDPKAIAVAMLLSLTLDVVGGAVLMAAFSTGLSSSATPEQQDEAIRAVLQDTSFLLVSLVYGIATTAIGGYVAARMARAYPYFNALATGVLGIVLGLLLASAAPWWFDALGYLANLPAALLGGHWGRRRNQ
jgi:uncharacterized protein YacL